MLLLPRVKTSIQWPITSTQLYIWPSRLAILKLLNAFLGMEPMSLSGFWILLLHIQCEPSMMFPDKDSMEWTRRAITTSVVSFQVSSLGIFYLEGPLRSCKDLLCDIVDGPQYMFLFEQGGPSIMWFFATGCRCSRCWFFKSQATKWPNHTFAHPTESAPAAASASDKKPHNWWSTLSWFAPRFCLHLGFQITK